MYLPSPADDIDKDWVDGGTVVVDDVPGVSAVESIVV